MVIIRITLCNVYVFFLSALNFNSQIYAKVRENFLYFDLKLNASFSCVGFELRRSSLDVRLPLLADNVLTHVQRKCQHCGPEIEVQLSEKHK